MNAVEKELLKATAAKAQGKSESRQAFLTRLGKAVNELGEDDYAALSDEAVTGYEGAVKAAKSKKSLLDFEGPEVEDPEDEDPEVEDPEVEDQEVDEKPNKVGKGKKKVSAKKAPVKKAPEKKAGPAKKAPAKKKGGIVIQHRKGSVREKAHRIFEDLYAKGKSRKAILAAFAKLGWAEATCATQYQVFKQLS